MNDELMTKIRLEALITEREGMIAENKIREVSGESLAYAGDAFFSLGQEIISLIHS